MAEMEQADAILAVMDRMEKLERLVERRANESERLRVRLGEVEADIAGINEWGEVVDQLLGLVKEEVVGGKEWIHD